MRIRNNIPNILSWSRVVLSGAFVWLMMTDKIWAMIAATIIFIIAALTDYYDGYYARKLKAGSAFGTFFDPLADKFLTTAAFVAFTILDIIPLWMVLVVLLRDFGTTFLRIYFDKKKLSFKTSFAAKSKTFVQMTFISYILALMLVHSLKISEVVNQFIHNLLFSKSIWIAMLIITLLSLWTLFDYLIPLFKKTDTNTNDKK